MFNNFFKRFEQVPTKSLSTREAVAQLFGDQEVEDAVYELVRIGNDRFLNDEHLRDAAAADLLRVIGKRGVELAPEGSVASETDLLMRSYLTATQFADVYLEHYREVSQEAA